MDLGAALVVGAWPEREAAPCRALETLHSLQGDVGLSTVENAVEPFWGRPSRGLGAVAEAVTATIEAPLVRGLPSGVGSVEQWVDDVDVLMDPGRRVAAARSIVQGGTSSP